jgi:hypothetical protein
MAASGVSASRPFLRYWRAQAVSGLGTYVTLFALQALVVLTLHGSAADVGWLNAARWLPYLVFGLVVGALVDGVRRLPLMVGSDWAQAAFLVAIPVTWWVGFLSMPVLLLTGTGHGTAGGATSRCSTPRSSCSPITPASHSRWPAARRTTS